MRNKNNYVFQTGTASTRHRITTITSCIAEALQDNTRRTVVNAVYAAMRGIRHRYLRLFYIHIVSTAFRHFTLWGKDKLAPPTGH